MKKAELIARDDEPTPGLLVSVNLKPRSVARPKNLQDHHLHLPNVRLIHTNWNEPWGGGGGGNLSEFPNQWTRKDGCGDLPEGNQRKCC